jgi:hypothetical protein
MHHSIKRQLHDVEKEDVHEENEDEGSGDQIPFA